MDYNVTGVVTSLSEVVMVKEWPKQVLVVDTGAEYNNMVALVAFGEKAVSALDGVAVGSTVTAHFNIRCNESNAEAGRWFTELSLWRVTEDAESAQTGGGEIPAPAPVPSSVDDGDEDNDDLPF